MDRKTTGIVAYLTWIGWLIALLAGDKEGAKPHLNQVLVLWIFGIIVGAASGILAVIPFIGVVLSAIVGGVGSIASLVFWIMGFVDALNDRWKPLPVIGGIAIIK